MRQESPVIIVGGGLAGLEALLAADVRSVSDGAGRFYTARVPVVGRERVALFYSRIAAPRLGSRCWLRGGGEA